MSLFLCIWENVIYLQKMLYVMMPQTAKVKTAFRFSQGLIDRMKWAAKKQNKSLNAFVEDEMEKVVGRDVRFPKLPKEYFEKSKEAFNFVMQNLESLKGSQRELALTYKNAGRDLVGQNVEDLFIHELGHHAEWTLLDAKSNNLFGSRISEYAPKISGYANANKHEYLAESFAAYMKGERGILDPEFVKFLDDKLAP